MHISVREYFVGNKVQESVPELGDPMFRMFSLVCVRAKLMSCSVLL